MTLIFVANATITLTKQISLQFNCAEVLSIAKGVTVLIKTIPQHSLADETTHKVPVNMSSLPDSKSCPSIQLFDISRDEIKDQKYDIKISWSLQNLWSSWPIECDMGNYSNHSADNTLEDKKLLTILLPVCISLFVCATIIPLVAIVITARICKHRCQHGSQTYQPLPGKIQSA